MQFLSTMFVGGELLTLLAVYAVARKAPGDFYLLVFLLGVLAYRRYSQKVTRQAWEARIAVLPSDKAEIQEKIEVVWSCAALGVDAILLIALIVIAIR